MRNMYLENKKRNGSKSARHIKAKIDTISLEDLEVSQKMGSTGENTLRASNKSSYKTQSGKTHKQKEEIKPPPWSAVMKTDTKNRLYTKMKTKFGDVSNVFGFNTARGSDNDDGL